VRLEAAARKRDAEELCASIYLFPDGSAQCEETMNHLFPARDGFSITIRSVQFAGPRDATASAKTIIVDEAGRRVKSPETEYRLRRIGATWRVVFVT